MGVSDEVEVIDQRIEKLLIRWKIFKENLKSLDYDLDEVYNRRVEELKEEKRRLIEKGES